MGPLNFPYPHMKTILNLSYKVEKVSQSALYLKKFEVLKIMLSLEYSQIILIQVGVLWAI